MKKNIKTEIRNDMKWYRWDEYCDCCGEPIMLSDMLTTRVPDTEEADFCLKCMRKFMDEGIPYSEAKKKYKKDIKSE